MATYALTVSTNALGLGVLNGARILVDRKRTVVSDIFPSSSLYKKQVATNSSGIATVALEPDDGSTFHEIKIFDLSGITVYTKIITMPPQAIALDLLPIQDIISASAAQAVSAATTATAQATIATTQATLATAKATLTAADAAATAADRVQTSLDRIQVSADAIAAESARDAAFTNANVYESTSAGLAATTNGQQFTVVVGMFLNRYRRDDASTDTLVASTPNSTASMQEYRYGAKSGRLDSISFYSQIVERQTLGGSTSPLTLSATGGLTIAISSAGNSRIFAMSTPYYVENGIFVAELTATVSTIPATRTPGIGFAIGGAGVNCRHYMWRSDGLITRGTDAESFITILAANSTTAFVATDVIKFKIEVDTETAKAVITCTKNGVVVAELNQSSVPTGLLEFTSRGEGGFVVSNIYTDGVSSEAMNKIEEAAAPELTATNKSSLYLSQQFFDAFEIFTPNSWTGASCPIRVFDINNAILTDYNPTDHYPFALADADSVYYVDVATGSDSNAGTALAPFKSLRYAIHGRTGNVLVYVKAGEYLRADGFNDPNPLCTGLIIKRWGDSGRIVSSMQFSGLSWSLTSGKTNTYQTTAASATLAVDKSNLSAAGDYTRLTLQTSIDNVEANANSYYISGSTVYVHTFDNRSPDSNILVFESKRNFLYNVADGTVWAEYLDCLGGDRPAQVSHTLDHSKQAECHFFDCTFKYGGGTRNGFSTDGEVYSYLKLCKAEGSVADGFNYHKLASSAPPVAVEIDCVGYSNGWNGATINNGSTMHDAGTAFRINGSYGNSEGRIVHDVGNSHSWNVNCSAVKSRSVVSSPVSNVAFAAGIDTDSTKMYLYKCSDSETTYSCQTISNSVIYRTGHTSSSPDVAGSDIRAYA